MYFTLSTEVKIYLIFKKYYLPPPPPKKAIKNRAWGAWADDTIPLKPWGSSALSFADWPLDATIVPLKLSVGLPSSDSFTTAEDSSLNSTSIRNFLQKISG